MLQVALGPLCGNLRLAEGQRGSLRLATGIERRSLQVVHLGSELGMGLAQLCQPRLFGGGKAERPLEVGPLGGNAPLCGEPLLRDLLLLHDEAVEPGAGHLRGGLVLRLAGLDALDLLTGLGVADAGIGVGVAGCADIVVHGRPGCLRERELCDAVGDPLVGHGQLCGGSRDGLLERLKACLRGVAV